MADIQGEAAPAYVYVSNVHLGNVLLSMNDQRKRGLLCDISIIVQDTEFKAHKAILASCSSYFDKIITDPANVSHNIVLELSSISKVGMDSLLEFAYTSKLTVNLGNIDDVICAARELEFKNIEFSCLNYLKQQLLAGKSSSSFLGSQETTSFCGNSTISRQGEPCKKQFRPQECCDEKKDTKSEISFVPSKNDCPLLSKLSLGSKKKKSCGSEQSATNLNDGNARQEQCDQLSQEQHQAMIKRILERHGLEPATLDERAMEVGATETTIGTTSGPRCPSVEKKLAGYPSPSYYSDPDEGSLDGESDSSICPSRPCGKLRKQPAIKLPFTMEEITSMPRSDLHDMLTKNPNLTQEQICAIHEIRRRGKNRIAAQRCRKRKMECIKSLVQEIDTLRYEHARLMKERREAREQAITLSDKFKQFFKCDKKACLIKKFCSNNTTPVTNEETAPLPANDATAQSFQGHAQRAHDLCVKLKEAPADDLPPFTLVSSDGNSWPKHTDHEEVTCTIIDDSMESNYQACSPSSAYAMSPSQGLGSEFGNIHISPKGEPRIPPARTSVLQHTSTRQALPPFSSLVLSGTMQSTEPAGEDTSMTDLTPVKK